MRESGRMKFSCPASTLSCSSIVFYDWRIHEKLDDTLHMQLGIASLWINSDVHVIHTISVDMFVYALDLVCKRCFGKFIFQIHHVSRPKNFRTNEKSIELCVCVRVWVAMEHTEFHKREFDPSRCRTQYKQFDTPENWNTILFSCHTHTNERKYDADKKCQ